MAGEIIGEILVGAIELAAEVAIEEKKPGCGCAIIIALLLVLGFGIYYFN